MNYSIKWKSDEKQKNTPKRKDRDRFSSSKNVGTDVIIDSSFHKSIHKKMSKRRSNLENLWAEWYISFQKLLSTEMRKIDRRDSYLIDIHMRNQNSGEPPTPKLTPIRSKNSFNDEIEKEDNENK